MKRQPFAPPAAASVFVKRCCSAVCDVPKNGRARPRTVARSAALTTPSASASKRVWTVPNSASSSLRMIPRQEGHWEQLNNDSTDALKVTRAPFCVRVVVINNPPASPSAKRASTNPKLALMASRWCER